MEQEKKSRKARGPNRSNVERLAEFDADIEAATQRLRALEAKNAASEGKVEERLIEIQDARQAFINRVRHKAASVTAGLPE